MQLCIAGLVRARMCPADLGHILAWRKRGLLNGQGQAIRVGIGDLHGLPTSRRTVLRTGRRVVCDQGATGTLLDVRLLGTHVACCCQNCQANRDRTTT